MLSWLHHAPFLPCFMLHLLLCQALHNDCCTMTGLLNRLHRQKTILPYVGKMGSFWGQITIYICHYLTNNNYMSYSHSRHWSLVGIRPRLAQASCTAAVHSRQLMELGEPPAAVRVPAWLPPDADRLPVGSPENDMNVLKGLMDRTLFLFPSRENSTRHCHPASSTG